MPKMKERSSGPIDSSSKLVRPVGLGERVDRQRLHKLAHDYSVSATLRGSQKPNLKDGRSHSHNALSDNWSLRRAVGNSSCLKARIASVPGATMKREVISDQHRAAYCRLAPR